MASRKPPVSKTRPGVGLTAPRAPSEERAIFDRLRIMLLRNALGLYVKRDAPGDVCLVTRKPHDGKELIFGTVQSRIQFVTFHLSALEMNPALREGMSAELERHLQGSAFNFSHIDEAQVAELAALTRRSLDDWKQKGLV
jgi:hypothetical protein